MDLKIQGDQNHDGNPLSLLSLNHISLVCQCLPLSLQFYEKVMGFQPVKRPSSLNFDGAWLFNYGVGIHLLQSETLDTHPLKISTINPRDNHISFQCSDISLTEKRLTDMGIDYVKRITEEAGVYIDQLFFHDPDGYMIEIRNRQNIPIIPAATWNKKTNINLNVGIEEVPQLLPLKTADPTHFLPFFRYEKETEAFETNSRCSKQVRDKEEIFILDILDIFI